MANSDFSGTPGLALTGYDENWVSCVVAGRDGADDLNLDGTGKLGTVAGKSSDAVRTDGDQTSKSRMLIAANSFYDPVYYVAKVACRRTTTTLGYDAEPSSSTSLPTNIDRVIVRRNGVTMQTLTITSINSVTTALDVQISVVNTVDVQVIINGQIVTSTGSGANDNSGAAVLTGGHPGLSIVSVLGALFGTCVMSFAGSGTAGVDSLAADAYSNYTTYWVDTATGSAGNSGLVEGAPKATIVQGLALCSGAGAQRVIVSGDTTLAADLTFPVGGVSSSARLVLMGHPGKTMPKIHMNGFSVRPSKNATRPYVTLRKFEILDGDATAGLSGVEVGLNNSMDNFEGAFLYIHGIRRTNDDNCGAIYLKDSAAANAWIHHCKLNDIKLNTGVDFHNGSCIHSYQNAGVIVEYCDLSNAQNGMRWKEPPAGTSGPIIRYNKIYTYAERGVMLQNDNNITGASFTGSQIYGNLFYDGHGAAVNVYDTTNQATSLQIYNNTFADDTTQGMSSSDGVIEIRGCNGVVYHSNVSLGTAGRHFLTKDPTPVQNRVTECNYNVYRSAGYSTGVFTGAEHNYATLALWQSAKTTDAAADFGTLITANPDPNSQVVTTLSTHFTNTAARDYSIKAGSSLLGTGKAGVNPGYDKNNVGCGF